MAIDGSGNVYVVGGTSSFGAGSYDVFLLKLNSSGTLLWSKTWGGNSYDVGYDLAFEPGGNVYVAAESYSLGNRAVLLKFAPNGNLLATATWKGPATYDSGYSVDVDKSGNVVMTGTSWDYSVSPNHNSILILKFDNQGNFLWHRNLVSGSEDEASGSKTVRFDAAGDIFLGGHRAPVCQSANFSVCTFVPEFVKLDPNGNLLWATSWGGAGLGSVGGIAFDQGGNVIASGTTNAFLGGTNAAMLLKLDPSGNLLRSRIWGGNGAVSGGGVTVDPSGTAVLAGSAVNSNSAWQEVAAPASSIVPTLGVTSGNVATSSFGLGTPSGTVTTPTGVMDAGGGGSDALAITVNVTENSSVTVLDKLTSNTNGIVNGLCTIPPSVTTFTTTSPQVWLYFDVTGANVGDSAQMRFLRPDGVLYTTLTSSVSSPGQNGYYCFSYEIPISGAPAASYTGTWAIQVFWDQATTPLFTLNFTLSATGVPPAGTTFAPGEQLVTTFTAAPNNSDLLLYYNNDPLTVTGSPVFNVSLFNGSTLLGTYTHGPFTSNGVLGFGATFESPSVHNPFLDTVTVDFTSINNGTISGRLVVTVTGGSVSGFNPGHLILYDAVSTSTGFQGKSDITAGTTVLGTGALINAGGILNAASYISGAPVAPGTIVSVYGTFLLNSPLIAPGAPWPTSLGGLSMEFGGATAAPLYYVSGGQVNLQVPWELAGKSQTTLTATINGQNSAAQTVNLAQFSPGIFSMNGQGTGQGAIVDALSGLLVNSSNAAIAGSTYLSIYCTGLGPVSNQPASGAASPSNPLAMTTATPTVMIGGVPAQVLFSGLAPGFVSEYQVNVQVPAGVAAGNATPVVILIGGATSNTVTITVVQPPPNQNPAPAITGLSPSSAAAGTSSLTLTINGTGFLASSSVTFRGINHAASFISSNQLSIVLTSSDLATAGTYPVVVSNPPPGGGSSPSATFTVQSPATLTLIGISFTLATLTGGASTTGSVRLSGAAPSGGGVLVSLSSNNSSVQVPATVSVAAGQSSASFTITTTAVTSTQTVTVTATLGTAQLSLNLMVIPATTSGPFQKSSFDIYGTLNISGQAVPVEIQTLALSDGTLGVLSNSGGAVILITMLFNQKSSVSGNTLTYSGVDPSSSFVNTATSAFYFSITSATLSITVPSPTVGAAVTGVLQFTSSGTTLSGTITATIKTVSGP